jgi:hypothetical protein
MKMATIANRRARRPGAAWLNADTPRTIIFALIAFAISFIAWPEIFYEQFGKIFIDREIYISKILGNDHWITYYELDGPLSFFTNEYIWEISQWSLSEGLLPIDYETFFQIVSTLVITSMAMVIARTRSNASILFLANPLVIDLAYSQLRSALAISILYLLYAFNRKFNWLSAILIGISFAIHTSMVIFISAFILCRILTEENYISRRMSDGVRTAIVCGAGVAFGLAIGPLRGIVLAAVGDRRAEYIDISSSFLYLSFWIGLFAFMVMNYRKTIQNVEGAFTLFILSILLVNVFSAAYSLRFLALAFPLIVVAIYKLNPERRYFIISIFSIYVFAQWYYYIENLTGL